MTFRTADAKCPASFERLDDLLFREGVKTFPITNVSFCDEKKHSGRMLSGRPTVYSSFESLAAGGAWIQSPPPTAECVWPLRGCVRCLEPKFRQPASRRAGKKGKARLMNPTVNTPADAPNEHQAIWPLLKSGVNLLHALRVRPCRRFATKIGRRRNRSTKVTLLNFRVIVPRTQRSLSAKTNSFSIYLYDFCSLGLHQNGLKYFHVNFIKGNRDCLLLGQKFSETIGSRVFIKFKIWCFWYLTLVLHLLQFFSNCWQILGGHV